MNPEDIIKGVTRASCGRWASQVNTVNGDFVFNISEGYLIENGKVGEPHPGATLPSGTGRRYSSPSSSWAATWASASAPAARTARGPPVADAQPTLLIPEITVGGEIEKP